MSGRAHQDYLLNRYLIFELCRNTEGYGLDFYVVLFGCVVESDAVRVVVVTAVRRLEVYLLAILVVAVARLTATVNMFVVVSVAR